MPPQLAGKEIYLMVSRLVKEKGVYDVLYAWRMYLRKADNPEKKIFVSISTGPEKENMLRIIKEWGMEDKFLFIDQVPYSEILNYYKAAKCLVLNSIPNPTWQEQFGYVLAESISAGTPVISTYCGAIPETVGQAGILVTPANPVALRDALLRLDDPIIYENLKNDCEIEMKKFAIEEYARKMAGIYRSLI